MNSPDTQEASDFLDGATEPTRRRGALEASHRTVLILDASVILFKAIVQVGICPMPHRLPEFTPDRRVIRVVTVTRDPVGHRAGDRPGSDPAKGADADRCRKLLISQS
jgi:hypothetical protein